MNIRVTVGDTWMPLQVQASSSDTVASVKARALESQKIDPLQGAKYEVKVGGGRVTDESQSLSAVGLKDGGQLIVLSRRRRPVR